MQPALEPPAVPRSPEAVAAGNVVLRTALAAVLTLLTGAGVLTAGIDLPATPAETYRPLPLTAALPVDAASWNGVEVSGDRLRVAARGANGAVAVVRDGAGWSDYTVRTHLRWTGGRAMSVHVRERGPADFIACVLEGRTARIDETTGGVTRTLASAQAPAYAGKALDAVVVADGRRIGFAVDGRTLVTAEAESRRGTAGLAVWDPVWDEAALEADYFRVEPTIAALAPVAGSPLTAPAQALGPVE